MFNKYYCNSVLTFLLTIFSTSVVIAACEITELGPDSFSLRTHKSTTVTVLGWTHITDESNDLLKRGLQDQLSPHLTCSQVETHLKALISSRQGDVDQYHQMQRTLTDLAKRNSTARIGVEQTFFQLQRHQAGLQNLRTQLKPLAQRCGDAITDELHLITSVLAGPDHQVAKSLNRPVIALENEEIKNNNYLDFQVPETFNYEDPRITADGQAALSLIRNSILSLNMPSESVMNRVVAFEAKPAERAELKKNLKLSIHRWIEIMRGAYERNTFIAQQLLKSETSILLPIGYLHVNDLKQQLVQMCTQEAVFKNDPQETKSHSQQ